MIDKSQSSGTENQPTENSAINTTQRRKQQTVETAKKVSERYTTFAKLTNRFSSDWKTVLEMD